MPEVERGGILGRRSFLQAALAAPGTALAAPKTIKLRNTLPARTFGKTGYRLPVLACGGSALVEKWGKAYGVTAPSFAQRVEMVRNAYEQGIRYFDTSRNYQESEAIMGEALNDVRENVYLATKVGVDWEAQGIITRDRVRASVERSLKELKTTYVDCLQIHGPAFEYFGYDRAMEIYEELDRMRGEKLFRFVGVTGHTAFEPMYRLVDTRLFDTVFLAYGYFPKGMDTMLSHSNLQWREMVLKRARELNMGILAMKVLGSFVMGHNAKSLVPDFSEEGLRNVRAAALRWALRGEKAPVLVVGVSLPGDVEQNVETLRAPTEFTAADQKLLADFTSRAMASQTIRGLKVT